MDVRVRKNCRVECMDLTGFLELADLLVQFMYLTCAQARQ
jgi:hypothetical protein